MIIQQRSIVSIFHPRSSETDRASVSMLFCVCIISGKASCLNIIIFFCVQLQEHKRTSTFFLHICNIRTSPVLKNTTVCKFQQCDHRNKNNNIVETVTLFEINKKPKIHRLMAIALQHTQR